MLFFFLEKPCFWPLDSCLIPPRQQLDTCLFYRDFWVCSLYISIDSPSIEPIFFWSLCLLNRCSIPPWSIKVVFPSIPPRYLSIYWVFVLDRSSIPSWYIELHFSIYIYIYIWDSIWFILNLSISIPLTSLSIQSSSFHKNLSSLQDFSLVQASIPWQVF